MIKIAVLGGSFNPPHYGHLRILKTAAAAVHADLSLLIPTFSPPHKSTAGLAPAMDRFNMCELCAPEIGALASDMELIRGGKSYTVDTLLALHEKYGECKVYLAMGADMLVTLRDWNRYDEIILLADIVAFTRGDTDNAEFCELAKEIGADGANIRLLSMPPDGISSTDIRDRIHAGKSVEGLVPDSVIRYIAENHLYL